MEELGQLHQVFAPFRRGQMAVPKTSNNPQVSVLSILESLVYYLLSTIYPLIISLSHYLIISLSGYSIICLFHYLLSLILLYNHFRELALNSIENSCHLALAGHGIRLWKLHNLWAGFFGLLSTIIAIYKFNQVLRKEEQKEDSNQQKQRVVLAIGH